MRGGRVPGSRNVPFPALLTPEKTIKPAHVKSHMKVFINCLIENPSFDSQTKEFMTLKQSAFGSKCALSDKFLKDTLNCGVLESILSFAQVPPRSR